MTDNESKMRAVQVAATIVCKRLIMIQSRAHCNWQQPLFYVRKLVEKISALHRTDHRSHRAVSNWQQPIFDGAV
jgi:hypothetical protein